MSIIRIGVVILLAVCIAASTGRASGDEASAALAKYRDTVDQSIDKAFVYLAEIRKEDGTFPGQYGDTTAVSALAGMAYLSKGNSPGLGPYGDQIDKSIDLVLASEKQKGGKPTGYLVRTRSGKMYAHCISTLFLSEVSGMVDPERQKKIDDVLPRALTLIVDAQNAKKNNARFDGGWRYEPTSADADLSLTGWAVMALRSARLNGAAVPDATIERAVEFILRCQPKNATGEKGFGYQPGQGGKPAMTGVGILCLSLSGQYENKVLPRAGDYLLGRKYNGRWGGSHFFYGNYYCTQAMFQLGGQYWETWATQLYDNALKNQRPNGSWGDPYPTTMTVLAMTVSYRQLPVYQR